MAPSQRVCLPDLRPRSMKGMVAATLALATLWFIVSPAVAEDPDALAEKALKASGIAGQLEQISQAMLSAVPEDAFPDKKARSDAAAFLKERPGKAELVAIVRRVVLESVKTDDLVAVTGFFDSKAGKKIGKAQGSALEGHAVKRAREGRSIFLSLGEVRAARLSRIVRAQHVPENNGRLLIAVVKGLTDASLAEDTQAEARGENLSRRIKLIEQEILADQSRSEETALISLAHLARTLDDKELEELEAFEASEHASQFRSAVQMGLEQAVYRCARALGDYMNRPREPRQEKPRKPLNERSHQMDRELDSSSVRGD